MAHLHPIYGSVFLYLKIGVLNGTTLATERMIDSNGDGFFNPGFPSGRGTDTAKVAIARTGYADATTEINNFEVFVGTFLNKSNIAKDKFE